MSSDSSKNQLPKTAQELPPTLDQSCPQDFTDLEQTSATHPNRGNVTNFENAPFSESMPDYVLLDELGRGGMGVVYKARQKSLNRIVALKMILSGPVARMSDFARFRIEAESLAKIKHAGIVQIYDYGEHQGQPYFALEYVDGGCLATKFQGMPWTSQEAATLVKRLAEIIHVAHEHKIVHRDLKPGNILLTNKGQPKITDFGLAKRTDGSMQQTQTGAILGTPNYMAPEQAGGNGEIGPAADIYALGVILYEAVIGRPPFVGETTMDTLSQVIQDEPIPLIRLNPKVAKDVQTICLKCLEKDPARRYSTALELAEDLALYLDGRPIMARPISLVGRSWKWIKRRPAWASLIFVLVLSVLAAFIGIGYHSHQMSLALNEATQERNKAQRLFDNGHQLSKSLLSEHLNALARLPGSTKELERLSTQLLKYLDDLSKDAQDDTILLADIADAYERIGTVQGNPYSSNRGDHSSALVSYQKALKVRERLIQKRPELLLPRLQYQMTQKMIADVLFQQGKVDRAKKQYETVFENLRGLRKEHPKDNRVLAGIIDVLGSLGDIEETKANVADAVEHSRSALKLCDEFIPSTEAKQQVYLQIQMQQHHRLGQLLNQMNNIEEAAFHLQKNLEYHQSQYDSHRMDVQHQRGYTSAIISLADVEQKRWNIDRSRTLYLQALPVLRALANEDAGDDTAQSQLAKVLGRIGASYSLDKKENRKAWIAKGVPYLQEALTIYQRLADKTPTDIEKNRNLAITQSELASSYMGMQSFELAKQWYQQAIQTAKNQETIHPDSPIALELQADCLFRMGSVQAMEAMGVATNQGIEKSNPLFEQCFKTLSQSLDAWQEYEKKFKMDPRTTKLRDGTRKLYDYMLKTRMKLRELEKKSSPSTNRH